MKTRPEGWKRREDGTYEKAHNALTAYVYPARDEATHEVLPGWTYEVTRTVKQNWWFQIAKGPGGTLQAAKRTAGQVLGLQASLEDAIALLREPHVAKWDHKRVAFLKRLNR